MCCVWPYLVELFLKSWKQITVTLFDFGIRGNDYNKFFCNYYLHSLSKSFKGRFPWSLSCYGHYEWDTVLIAIVGSIERTWTESSDRKPLILVAAKDYMKYVLGSSNPFFNIFKYVFQ